MAKYDLETLRSLSKSLMFEMEEKDYLDLLDEFKMMLEQLKLLDEIEGIELAEAMDFPYIRKRDVLRDDIESEPLNRQDILDNAGDTYANQIKIPKVVK